MLVAGLRTSTPLALASLALACGLAACGERDAPDVPHGLATRIEDARVGGFVGGEPGTRGGSFTEPGAVATSDGTVAPDDGSIYVAERLSSNSRIQRLDGNGNFVAAWGRDVVRAGAPGDTGAGYEVCRREASCKAAPAGTRSGELDRPSGLTVSPSDGSVYVLDSGNARVQRFAPTGRPIGRWPIEPGAEPSRLAHASIAVAPSPPHDVYVGDPAANRVLQFDAHGSFQRAWGTGVATGSGDLEACTPLAACRAGRPPSPLRPTHSSRWPGALVVDTDGTVYGSVYAGDRFDSDEIRTRILRFAADPPPSGTDAQDRWLPPLRPADPSRIPEFPARYITNGTTLGIAFDSGSESLIAIANPFGTSKLDAVAKPASALPRTNVLDALPFLQNVHGIAVGEDSETILLASGSVRQEFGTSTYTGCPHDDAERDCHGLIVIGPPGPAGAVVTGSPATSSHAGFVDARGSARYRYEITRDGQVWRALGRWRQTTGSRYDPVPAPQPRLAPGTAYGLRLAVRRRTERGNESTTSNKGTFVYRR